MAILTVGVVYPDPPFNGVGEDRGGLDIDLITAIGERMGVTVDVVAYDGSDFNGVFSRLADTAYDCVIAGTTVTPERQAVADFAQPYLISGQSLAVDTARLPSVHSTDDLAGLTIGVQRGNTSQPIAQALVDAGRAGRVRVYDYGGIRSALADLTTGGCDAFMKLAPVLTELVEPVADVEVVQRGISREEIAIAVRRGDDVGLRRIADAQAALEVDGTLQTLRRRWLGNPYRDQSASQH